MENERSTLNKWVAEYTEDLFSWAYFKTSNKEVAEDLVQDTFFAAVKALPDFREESNPKTWLFAILNNKIADFHRKNSKNIEIHFSVSEQQGQRSVEEMFDENGNWQKSRRPVHWEEEPVNLLDDPQFKLVFEGCMGKLPEKWFSAVYGKYLDEKKGEQICQELEISPTNFWQILHRSKLKLRECLEIMWFKRK